MKEKIKRLINSGYNDDILLGLLLLSQNKKLFKSWRGLDIRFHNPRITSRITLKYGYIIIGSSRIKYYKKRDRLSWLWLNEFE